MTYKVKSSITKDMLESGIMDFYLGELLVWDMPCVLLPVNNLILQSYICKKFPDFSHQDISYQIGKMQSHRGNEVLINRFGYTPDQNLMKDVFGKSEFLGIGRFDFLDFNLKDKSFTVINVTSPYAHQCLTVLGKQEESQCHHLRGLCAGSFQPFFKDDEVFCVETSCIARGDNACVFKIRLLKDWDVNDENFKAQVVKNKLPAEIFEKYYNKDVLVSRNSGVPKNPDTEKVEDERIRGIIEQHKVDMSRQ